MKTWMKAKKIVATTATYSSAVMIQPESPITLVGPAGRAITPWEMFRTLTQTNSGIITAQTIMQNGHRIWMAYRAWDQSQTTNAKPSVTPACSPSQYQRANRAPARIPMAVVMITAKATIPMNMLGKPNTELCGVCMTWPQEIHGFTSQTVTWCGSFRTSNFSSTKAPEASQPTTPVSSRSQANGRSRVIVGRGWPVDAGPEPG